jgi:Uma2 family endonuclease
MNIRLQPTVPVVYPDSDGKPMAENTLQFRWIVTIQGNLDALFRDRADVFVAGDNLIYPKQGDPTVSQAPDVYVVFGRPKGYRGSYKVWEEDGIFPQVIFEVLSLSNTPTEMKRKRGFYRRYGVEEYYVYDPDANELEGWTREGKRFVEIDELNGLVSPRLGIRFDASGEELRIDRPDGQRFLTFLELAELVDQEKRQGEQEQRRADRLAAKLRELGIDPDAV